MGSPTFSGSFKVISKFKVFFNKMPLGVTLAQGQSGETISTLEAISAWKATRLEEGSCSSTR